MKAGDEEHCLFKLRNPWGDARVPLIFSDLFRQKAKGAVLGRCFSEKNMSKGNNSSDVQDMMMISYITKICIYQLSQKQRNSHTNFKK